MLKSFCDRCGEEYKEADPCEVADAKRVMKKESDLIGVIVFAHDAVGMSLDLCHGCMDLILAAVHEKIKEKLQASVVAQAETSERVLKIEEMNAALTAEVQALQFQIEQLTQKEKIRRLEILIALQNKIAGEINEAQVAEGRILDVLVEGRSPKDADYAQGQTRGGKTVHFLAGRDLTGKTVQVKVTQGFLWGFIGDLV
jgi:hypothetical protein